MTDATTPARRARALASAVEPVVGQVFFAPECHAAYEQLGFGPSPASTSTGVALPDGPAYFCSRAASMGQVPGEVAAAAFAVFNPEVVVPAVAHGWSLTDAPTVESARTEGAVAQLRRILGPDPSDAAVARDLLLRAVAPLREEGKPLFSGVRSLGLPGDTLADVWRLGDQLREYRGDAHTAAWTAAGLDATEIGLLTEPYWGLPMRTYVRTRAWSELQLDEAEERLRARGLVVDGSLTPAGRELRESIEVATDLQCGPALDALGDELDTLVGILLPWGAAIRDAGGYLPQGPHDLSAR